MTFDEDINDIMKLSDSIFLEQWAHSHFGKGDFRNNTYDRFTALGFAEERAWQLTNRVRKYVAAYAHFFDIDAEAVAANKKRYTYTVETLLVALTYKFAYEAATSTGNIFPRQRSATFRRAVATLEAPLRRVLTRQMWGDKPLKDVQKTWAIDQFPESFRAFWKVLFKEMDEAVAATIKIEKEANAYFTNKGTKTKIQRSTRTYINAVAALRAALREEVSETGGFSQ